MKTLYAILTLTVLFLSSCYRTTDYSCTKAICTNEFRSITVALKDNAGNGYTADRVETYNAEGKLIHSETIAFTPGEYKFTVVDDSDLLDLGVNMNREVTFRVIENNQVLKTTTFVVKADCCHVSKVSGPDEIIVN